MFLSINSHSVHNVTSGGPWEEATVRAAAEAISVQVGWLPW